ncbi:hypothetical protein [Pseudomonas sp. Irchel 3E13]|uniref:hypothetical protein n=1 Tax=Pseudomonas sp. Irchel 3E13 TaxID=2008975 RepID=UPI000BA4A561|nr:hypothetical protein [Pseudomonas sp. Irchel 3E13]
MKTKITSSTQIKFAQRLRYNGVWVHDVWVDGEYFQIEVGDDSYSGKRDLFSGLSDEEYERDVVGRTNTVTLMDRTAPHEVLVAAFNQWRSKLHAERVQRLRSQPERFGVISEDDPSIQPYPEIVPVRYEQGQGWVRAGGVV